MDTYEEIQADGTLIDPHLQLVLEVCYEPCGADEYIDGMTGIVLPNQERRQEEMSVGQQHNVEQGRVLLVRTV